MLFLQNQLLVRFGVYLLQLASVCVDEQMCWTVNVSNYPQHKWNNNF